MQIVYPPANYQTQSARIFILGTALPNGEVRVNGQVVSRSKAGHFAPSFALDVGLNVFRVSWQDIEQVIQITRLDATLVPAKAPSLLPESMVPVEPLACLPDEVICFSVIGTPGARVRVLIGGQIVTLAETDYHTQLPANQSLLTNQNQPRQLSQPGLYQGWTRFHKPEQLGQPRYQLEWQEQQITHLGQAAIEVLDPAQLSAVAVTAWQADARTGPGTDYARLTPLPQRTQATVTGRSGSWLRLDYGGWLSASHAQPLSLKLLPSPASVRSVACTERSGWTDVILPLTVPVPISVRQEADRFWLTLHNTVVQTDLIRLSEQGWVQSLTWQQQPNQVECCLRLKSPQQWGYCLRYEGSSLVLSLRHPPDQTPLIMLDPGHGGEASGARGLNGLPEKDLTLSLAQQVQERLLAAGLRVSLTRQADVSLSLQERTQLIESQLPSLCLSLHYNALPDDGDAEHTQGLSAFWYHPQSLELARFLLCSLLERLNRQSHGLYWGNFALTRPSVCPAVLLELGFLINPEEFEWIVEPQTQTQVAQALADAIVQWLHTA
ncbi:N-acetylmuramoyl-L-alanine amidase [Leptolyngbya sp. FACHB-261]|uniref:N-acetylmuramoyl-L-alanine amidase n=1 Tax=Leptolyngbya sp. FACHB-261 TaxID=2692806 RepID=UPI0016828A1E|nr:N-acetylmuramoyl-L-alanine amidase [Leptolyngbya sp. FACHB-261]MBD2101541.1 N-acetylmuramoyl-L-alanine amidase [Leptolyngbya sp. FACHB-261]